MNPAICSLRWAVYKWLPQWQRNDLRASRVACQRELERCVRIELQRPQGQLTLFFFRHDDGVWRVFPQVREPTPASNFLDLRKVDPPLPQALNLRQAVLDPDVRNLHV